MQLKIANLKSLDRVERIAREKLNMEEPERINYIVIDLKEERKTKKEKRMTANNKDIEQDNKLSFNLEKRIEKWVKDLTTVQAGTLKENKRKD